MKDPDRLLRGDASPLERLLLDASSRERPAPELVARTRSVLGLPPAPPPLTLRHALTSWGPKVLLALAGAALVGTLAHRTHPVVVPSASAPIVTPTSAPTEPVKATSAPSPAAEAPTLSVDSLPLAPPEPNRAAAAAPSAMSADSLREEILQIDKVRAAIRRGAPAQALDELDTYRARFPRGVLQQESLVLRVQALQAAGRTAEATALGQSFLARHPKSPHAEKIARILGISTSPSQ